VRLSANERPSAGHWHFARIYLRLPGSRLFFGGFMNLGIKLRQLPPSPEAGRGPRQGSKIIGSSRTSAGSEARRDKWLP